MVDTEFLKRENEMLNRHKGELIDKLWALGDENKRLREALEFYADEDNNRHKRSWTLGQWEMMSEVTQDEGYLARKVLGGV